MRLTRAFARQFCQAISESHDSLFRLIKQNPHWPSWNILVNWRNRNPWFAEAWRRAREDQGEHLAQMCLDLAAQANPKNAHAIRVKYDVYKWVASRFAPAVYGDKPAQITTNVAVGINLSPERLNEIRSKLDITRTILSKRNGDNSHSTDTNAKNKRLPLDSTSHA